MARAARCIRAAANSAVILKTSPGPSTFAFAYWPDMLICRQLGWPLYTHRAAGARPAAAPRPIPHALSTPPGITEISRLNAQLVLKIREDESCFGGEVQDGWSP